MHQSIMILKTRTGYVNGRSLPDVNVLRTLASSLRHKPDPVLFSQCVDVCEHCLNQPVRKPPRGSGRRQPAPCRPCGGLGFVLNQVKTARLLKRTK